MPKTLPTLFALLVGVSLTAAAPQITGDTQVKPGGFAALTVTGAGNTVLWEVSPEPIQAEEISGVLVFTAAPGTYRARAIIIDFDAKKITRLSMVVVFAGGPIPPGPGPAPVPPGPTPPAPISPFAKRLQDAATADGWAKNKLSEVADAVTRAAAAFRAGVTNAAAHADAKGYLATCPPLGKSLAKIIDEQVTATLNELAKDPAGTMDADTAKRLGDLFRALASALQEAAR